jgi:hydrogenase expression/formation protein HypE
LSDTVADFTLSCPAPFSRHDNITLAHGGGGKLTHDLIERLFVPAFDNGPLR